MINLTSEWQKLGCEVRGEKIEFEARPLTKDEYLTLLPYMREDMTADDTAKIIDIAAEIIPVAVRNFEGLSIDGQSADPETLCTLGSAIIILPQIIRVLIEHSSIGQADEKNSEGQSTS